MTLALGTECRSRQAMTDDVTPPRESIVNSPGTDNHDVLTRTADNRQPPHPRVLLTGSGPRCPLGDAEVVRILQELDSLLQEASGRLAVDGAMVEGQADREHAVTGSSRGCE